MSAVRRYKFAGRDARGYGRGGDVRLADLAAWVEKNWRAGWQCLTVHHVPERETTDGRLIAVAGAEWPVVAKIERGGGGARSWWAEG